MLMAEALSSAGHFREQEAMPVEGRIGGLFLDRDGTLIENKHYLSAPEGVVLLPGVREALQRARHSGAKLFLFTNQSGVGRGYFSMSDVERVNQRMLELLDLGDDLFTGVCIAPERPGDASLYRKPSPRFIQEMLALHGIDAKMSWMVGDTQVDWQAGINAGIRVAAVVPNPQEEPACDVRLELGVPAHRSLLDWILTVLV